MTQLKGRQTEVVFEVTYDRGKTVCATEKHALALVDALDLDPSGVFSNIRLYRVERHYLGAAKLDPAFTAEEWPEEEDPTNGFGYSPMASD